MTSAKVSVTKINCALALLLLARVAVAQNPSMAPPPSAAPTAPAASETTPAGPLKISCTDGQLRIDALDSTLGDVLTKVAALTGVKIETPAGASSERLPVVKLGPGPARQILASLLSGSS